MTATLTRAPQRVAPASGGGLAGTGNLIRFILRRDRIKLPAWLLIITVLVFYYAAALPEVLGDDMENFGQFMVGPVGALLAGPGYGSDAVTIERAIVGVYGLYFLLAAALMNILLVSRHTRVEEQTGRAELIRASVVGRYAQLTATLIVAAGANALLALLIGGAMVASFDSAPDALLFGAGVGAVGLVFAGITALTVQISEYSRAASGIAGAALGGAYVIRAAGDMLAGDAPGSLLSWFSPLAWSQQTRPYVDGRWWPLLLSIALAAVAAAAGYALSTRRDLGAGQVTARRGAATAAPWLGTPLAFAFRLHRSSLLWWAAALAASGLLFGAISEPLVDAYADADSEVLVDVLGGDAANLLAGYLSTMGLVVALMVAVFAILGIQAARTEETRGRAEPVLATATSRWAWLGGNLVVLGGGVVALLLVAGLAMGLASALSLGDGGYVWDVTAAHLVHVPGVLVLLGVATLLFGVLPKALGAAWAVFGYAVFMGFFGALLADVVPRWAYDISPMEHASRLPLEDMAWPPVVVLALIAAVLLAAGLAGFRRRDLETK